MKIAAAYILLLSYASVVLSFPMCTNGATPLMEANDAFPCSKGCPLGFNCEYQDSQLNAYKGICCADATMLNNIYGEENSMHTEPIWDRNAIVSSTNKAVEAEPQLETPQSSTEAPAKQKEATTVTPEVPKIDVDSAQTAVVASEVKDKSKGDSEEMVPKGLDTQMLNQKVTVIGSEEEDNEESVKSTETPLEKKYNLEESTIAPEEVTSSTASIPVLESTTQENNETTEAVVEAKEVVEIPEPIVTVALNEIHTTNEPVAVEPPFQIMEKPVLLEKSLGSEHETGQSAIFVDTHTENTAENNATVTPQKETTVDSTTPGIVSDIESPMEEVGIFGRLPIPRDSLAPEKREYTCERQNYSATCQDGSLNTQPTIRWAWSKLTNSCEFYQFGYCPGDRIVESLTIRSREECAARCSGKTKDQLEPVAIQSSEAEASTKEELPATTDPLEATTEFSPEIADGFGEVAHPEASKQFTESPDTAEEDLQNQYEMGETKSQAEASTETSIVADADKQDEATVSTEASKVEDVTAAGVTMAGEKVNVAEETTRSTVVDTENNSHNENTVKTVTVVEDITMDESKKTAPKQEMEAPEATNVAEQVTVAKEVSEQVKDVASESENKVDGVTVTANTTMETVAKETPCDKEQKNSTLEHASTVDHKATATDVPEIKEDSTVASEATLDEQETLPNVEIPEETVKPEETLSKESNITGTDQNAVEVAEKLPKFVDQTAVGSEVTAEFEETAQIENNKQSGANYTDFMGEATTDKTDSERAMTESQILEDNNKIVTPNEANATMDKMEPVEVDNEASEEEENEIVTEKKLRAELLCSATNYRIFCLSGMPTQFVYRWQLIEGECHSFPYGYCFGEFNHGHPRTKLECEQYCIEGKPLIGF